MLLPHPGTHLVERWDMFMGNPYMGIHPPPSPLPCKGWWWWGGGCTTILTPLNRGVGEGRGVGVEFKKIRNQS